MRQRYAIQVATAPATEPVSLAEAKAFLRVDTIDDEPQITAMIAAAREFFEKHTGMALISQEIEMFMDHFPLVNGGANSWWDGVLEGPITDIVQSARFVELPLFPIISVEAISTRDDEGEETVFDEDSYVLDSVSRPPRIVLKKSASWPQVDAAVNGVKIEFTAGYANANAVPKGIKHVIHQLIAHFYENRVPVTETAHSVLPMGLQSQLDQYRMRRL